MQKNHAEGGAAGVLRSHGFRATGSRIALLDLLQREGKPLSVLDILASWRGRTPDQATLYRTLTDLAGAGIVSRVDLNTGKAHFEYTPDRPHHHHIICNQCGTIEDIENCFLTPLQRNIMSSSTQFKKIQSHNLVFFGQCVNCE